jgi:hypothetical protein
MQCLGTHGRERRVAARQRARAGGGRACTCAVRRAGGGRDPPVMLCRADAALWVVAGIDSWLCVPATSRAVPRSRTRCSYSCASAWVVAVRWLCMLHGSKLRRHIYIVVHLFLLHGSGLRSARRACAVRACTCGRRACTCGRRACTCGRRACTCGRRACTCGRRACTCGRRAWVRRCMMLCSRRSRALYSRMMLCSRRKDHPCTPAVPMAACALALGL